MIKRIVFIIIAIVLALGLALPLMPRAGADTGNLLVNPDAETGDMTGWTHSPHDLEPPIAKTFHIQNECDTVMPNSDSYFFAMGLDETVSTSWMKQTVDLSPYAAGSYTFDASGWVQTEAYEAGPPTPPGYDYGTLIVEFFASDGSPLGVFTLDPVEFPICGPSAYGQFSLTDTVPSGATSAVYMLEGHDLQQTYINVFYDDLYFSLTLIPPTPTPTPTSPPPVGGTIIPTDKLVLAVPWVIGAALVAVSGVSLAVWNRKRATEKVSRR